VQGTQRVPKHRRNGGWSGLSSRVRRRRDNNFVTSLVSTNVTGLRFKQTVRQNERADLTAGGPVVVRAVRPEGDQSVGRSTEQNPNDLQPRRPSPSRRRRSAHDDRETSRVTYNMLARTHTHTQWL